MSHGAGGTPERVKREDAVAIAQAVGLATVAVIPAFLIGALAVSLRAELGFGPSGLGLVIAWFFVVASACSTMLGQVVERVGVGPSLAIGATASGTALFGVAFAQSLTWLLVAMTLGGASNAITQPAVNASLSRRIAAGRLGLAFGIKQSAIPAATLLGGLAVPTLGVLLGWRGTFMVVGVCAFIGAVVGFRSGQKAVPSGGRKRRNVRDLPELKSLVILSCAGLLGAAASTSLGSFFVDAGVEAGLAESAAGLLFALASALGLSMRILLGWIADLRPYRSRFSAIATLLFVGVPGYLLLATGVPAWYIVGGVFAYAAGWSWPGLYHYTVVSQNPTMPAAATGVIQTGMSFGGGLGPLLVGFVAERTSYDIAWLVAAALACGSATMFLVGRAHLRRARRTAAAAYLDEVSALRFDDERFDTVARGVESQRQITDHLNVTLYRAAPGVTYEVPPAARTGVVLVLSEGVVRLQVATVDSVAQAGEHVPVPANRSWSLSNGGRSPLLLAQVEYHGLSVSN